MSLFPRIHFPNTMRRWIARGATLLTLAVLPPLTAATQPTQAEVLPLDQLRPGMTGEVWTVFRGTEPEPFAVEVTGVIQNALGPGKSMILCQLTDPRVQKMGAVAGMSGSPLYIDGRFAGALSYQVQRFETERFAGFTPAADLLEVRRIAMDLAPETGDGGGLPAVLPGGAQPQDETANDKAIQPLSLVFSFGGIAPAVADLMSGPLQQLGIATTSLGGVMANSTALIPDRSSPLGPGHAVGAALAVGDITLAGTGTVSQVDGDRVLAFGHPLLGLGTVEVPMTEAEVVAILPSNLSSFKISNTGGVIGTVRQDRLSAIYGELGRKPPLMPVTVHTPVRDLEFSTVKHPRLTPVIAATGVSQAVLGSNDAGLTEGFALRAQVTFPGGRALEFDRLYAGPEGFKAGLTGLMQHLGTWMQNPVEEVFPEAIEFTVEALATNPTASLDNATLSRRVASPGERVTVALSLRDFQGRPWIEQLEVPVSEEWLGRPVQVIVASGPVLDELAGGQRAFPVSQIRDIDAYLAALQSRRRADGLFVAVVSRSTVFLDQTTSLRELPGSLSRIARTADTSRFSEKPAAEVLWTTHLLEGRLVPGVFRLPLAVEN